MQVTTRIREVTRRTVTPKNGNSEFVLFEIEDSDGTKWTTREQELALVAHSRVGQDVVIDGVMKENGQYKNYYINNILDPQDVPVIPVTTAIPSATPSSDERESRIARMTAAKVSAHLAESAEDFWNNLDPLVDYFLTGNKPGNQFVPQEAITAGVGAGSSYVDNSDDLPF